MEYQIKVNGRIKGRAPTLQQALFIARTIKSAKAKEGLGDRYSVVVYQNGRKLCVVN